MVVSKINPAVIYTESKTIDPEDVGSSSYAYELDVFSGQTISVVLGKLKYIFAEKNVVFFPIYAVTEDIVRSYIGVFEFEPAKLQIIIKNGELDVSRLSRPVLFSFATESYVRKLGADPALFHAQNASMIVPPIEKPRVDEPSTEPALSEEDARFKITVPASKVAPGKRDAESTLENGVFTVDKERESSNGLVEETDSMADEIRKEYRESATNTWIEKYMKNNHYRIKSVLGDGNCYFTTIINAFDHIGRKTTVDKLRAILANEVTLVLYNELRDSYLRYDTIIKQIQTKMNTIQRAQNKLKKEIKNSVNTSPEKIEQSKQNVEKFNRLKHERDEVAQNQKEDIGYMENIQSVDDLRNHVKQYSYWADEWAISTLERILNFKTIILSEESFKSGSTDNVMKCGIVDAGLEQRGTFTPEFYVMVSHTGNHYDLITYRDKPIFRFSEIPYDIKMLILNKCLEKNAGPYYLIEDFRNLKTRFGLDADEGRSRDFSDEDGNGDLYDDTVQFIIHSRAPNEKTKPGKVADDEKIPANKTIEFIPLSKITEWRKKLDDTWMDTIRPIKIKRDTTHSWASVFHYLEGSKFRMGHPDIYAQFSMESGNPTSSNIQLAKTHKQLELGTVKRLKPDVDYVLGRDAEERDAALRAKFKSDPEMRSLLLLTKNALLLKKIHYGQPAEPDMMLMKIRKELQREE